MRRCLTAGRGSICRSAVNTIRGKYCRGKASGAPLQDTRATALRERFFAYGETALAPLPALKTSVCAIRLFPTARMSWSGAPDAFLQNDASRSNLRPSYYQLVGFSGKVL
jgi:hypothetical protein